MPTKASSPGMTAALLLARIEADNRNDDTMCVEHDRSTCRQPPIIEAVQIHITGLALKYTEIINRRWRIISTYRSWSARASMYSTASVLQFSPQQFIRPLNYIARVSHLSPRRGSSEEVNLCRRWKEENYIGVAVSWWKSSRLET